MPPFLKKNKKHAVLTSGLSDKARKWRTYTGFEERRLKERDSLLLSDWLPLTQPSFLKPYVSPPLPSLGT
jgi:hypothetical protein